MKVRPLERHELEAATETLVLAFDDDPFFRDALLEKADRERWSRWFFLRALRGAFLAGGAFTLEGGPELGAMALHPPGTWPLSVADQVRTTPLPRGIPPWRLLRVGLPLEHSIHAAHPPGPHLYLYAIGVHPSQKGKGLGGALLRHVTELAGSVPRHLETSNPDNISLYRRFGFEVKEEITSHGGAPIWTMTT